MTAGQMDTFIGRHVAAWNQRDPELLSSDHADLGVVVSPMFHTVKGRSEILRSYANLFAAFPDWQIRYDEPFVNGNRMAVFFSVAATHSGTFMGVPGTGRRCAF